MLCTVSMLLGTSVNAQDSLFGNSGRNSVVLGPHNELLNDYKLQLVLEVTRHGQRAPGEIYDLAANPEENFSVPMNLTMTGAESHHATGSTLRKMINEKDPGFLSEQYSSDEMYVQTTDYARTIDSATAQLEGIYSMPLLWPSPDDTFDLNTVKEDDYLLRLDRDNCQRFD